MRNAAQTNILKYKNSQYWRHTLRVEVNEKNDRWKWLVCDLRIGVQSKNKKLWAFVTKQVSLSTLHQIRKLNALLYRGYSIILVVWFTETEYMDVAVLLEV